MLSFTLEDFLAVLKQYNLSIWPTQIFAYILGILALFFCIKKTKYSDKIVLTILSLLWFWNGIVFCPLYWAPTYKYAYGFGALLIIQGFLFMRNSIKSNISTCSRSNLQLITGLLFVIYAMAGYQLFGLLLNRVYPQFFPFGLVPCPTTIYTFGLFLVMNKRFPRYILFIPFILSISGLLAVYKGILEDIGLIIAGIVGTVLILQRSKKNVKHQP